MVSALDSTDRNALEEVLLQAEEQDEHGQSGDGGTGHHGAKQGGVGKLELLQADLNGIHRLFGGDQEGPEEVVPAGKEGVDGQHRQNGLGQGQHDMGKDLGLAAAVRKMLYDVTRPGSTSAA